MHIVSIKIFIFHGLFFELCWVVSLPTWLLKVGIPQVSSLGLTFFLFNFLFLDSLNIIFVYNQEQISAC